MGSEQGLGFSPWISGYQFTGMDHSKCLGERLKPNPVKRNAKHSFYPFLCRMHSFHTLLLETFCTLALQTRRKLFRVWTSSKHLVKDSCHVQGKAKFPRERLPQTKCLFPANWDGRRGPCQGPHCLLPGPLHLDVFHAVLRGLGRHTLDLWLQSLPAEGHSHISALLDLGCGQHTPAQVVGQPCVGGGRYLNRKPFKSELREIPGLFLTSHVARICYLAFLIGKAV